MSAGAWLATVLPAFVEGQPERARLRLPGDGRRRLARRGRRGEGEQREQAEAGRESTYDGNVSLPVRSVQAPAIPASRRLAGFTYGVVVDSVNVRVLL